MLRMAIIIVSLASFPPCGRRAGRQIHADGERGAGSRARLSKPGEGGAAEGRVLPFAPKRGPFANSGRLRAPLVPPPAAQLRALARKAPEGKLEELGRVGGSGVPFDLSKPLAKPSPTPPEKFLNELGGALGAKGGVALLSAAASGLVTAACWRTPSAGARPPVVRGASFESPSSLLRPAWRPLPTGGRTHAGAEEGARAADLEETGRSGPPAPAASLWLLRPALTLEVAPGPRRRRPFVSGAAWRRALCASPCTRRRRRPGKRGGGVGVQHLPSLPRPCAPRRASAPAPASPSHPFITHLSPVSCTICAPGGRGKSPVVVMLSVRIPQLTAGEESDIYGKEIEAAIRQKAFLPMTTEMPEKSDSDCAGDCPGHIAHPCEGTLCLSSNTSWDPDGPLLEEVHSSSQTALVVNILHCAKPTEPWQELLEGATEVPRGEEK
ncbi:hypothetical protein H8959_001205 [Pygathrix nigripes]